MIRQYFTYRQFPIPGGFITPDELMRKCYTGMKFNYELEISTNNEIDGRRLGWVEAETEDELNALFEGLAVFGAHKKAIVKIPEFIKQLRGIDVAIDGDKIKWPENNMIP